MSNIINLRPCKWPPRDVQLATTVLNVLISKYEKWPEQYSDGIDAAEEARSFIKVIRQLEGGQ